MKVNAVNKIEDYYKNHNFIAIPVCGYEDDDGSYVYDLDAMQDEVDNAFESLNVTVCCSITEVEKDKK